MRSCGLETSTATAIESRTCGNSSTASPDRRSCSRMLLNVPPVTRDPSDDQVIACAVAARAEYLVTGDDDMLVVAEYQGIRIISPRQFLDLLEDARAG